MVTLLHVALGAIHKNEALESSRELLTRVSAGFD